ncbi:unnamed protein product [Leptosia nina]|uniref:CHK kinase-like domain-containing protein n=1 Tax=Leptosia nina TaxID=320188 RepID=A0AAV1JPA6_9NEOP
MNSYITEEDVRLVVGRYFKRENAILQTYSIQFASKNMLGFLCDYLSLRIWVMINGDELVMDCFVKCISKNAADMVKEMKLFDKECIFYTDIKEDIFVTGIKPWSPKLIAAFNESMVFENLITRGYRMHNKLQTLDEAHTKQALSTLARFHASTIIYEEKRSKELKRPYSINEDYAQDLRRAGYKMTNTWFQQCMLGALNAVTHHSKYAESKDIIDACVQRWPDLWKAALDLSDFSSKYRNVICHRDLWNNNLLFHYVEGVPDDCLLVDFQAARCHPPAGDIMMLLYCNLDPGLREGKLEEFLDHYHLELDSILQRFDVSVNSILTLEDLYRSAEEYRLWGLVTSACLIPQTWMDDEVTTEIFTDAKNFDEILSRDKAKFLSEMLLNDDNYKGKVLDRPVSADVELRRSGRAARDASFSAPASHVVAHQLHRVEIDKLQYRDETKAGDEAAPAPGDDGFTQTTDNIGEIKTLTDQIEPLHDDILPITVGHFPRVFHVQHGCSGEVRASSGKGERLPISIFRDTSNF